MPKIERFDPPAHQNDFQPGEPGEQEFLQAWSENIRRWTEAAILGNPWGTTNDAPRDSYFNPLGVEIPADSPVLTIAWPANPGRLKGYFGDVYSDEVLWAM